MMRKCCLILTLVAVVGLASIEAGAQDNQNINCISQYYHNWSDGVADVAIDGGYAYLACGGEGLRIVDISRLDAAREVGGLDYNEATAVAKSGNYAYLSSIDQGFNIIDVYNPAAPQQVSNLNLLGMAVAIRIVENHAFVCGRGLTIIDINDPLNPAVVWESFGYNEVTDVEIHGNLAYAACTSQGFKVYDITNIASPALVATWVTGTGNWVNGATVAGNYAYLACGWDGLKVLDLTTMQVVSGIDSLSYGFRARAKGPYLYVTYGDPDCPLAIVDISNPLAPSTLGIYDPPEDIINFDLQGDIAYVADFEHGLRMVDISNPANPHEAYTYSRFGHDLDVTVSGDLAYVREDYKLKIIDLADPRHPLELGYFETIFRIKDMAISGGMAYVLDDAYACLYAVDISNPSSPVLMGMFTPSEYESHYSLALFGGYLYILGSGGLRIVDISNPAAMTEAGFYAGGGLNARMTVIDHYLVYQGSNFEMKVLDIANPLSPVPAGSYDIGQYEYCKEMAREGNRLYLITDWKLWVFDIGNPGQWTRLASIDNIGGANIPVNSVDTYGNLIYVAMDSLGLLAYDMTDPTAPLQVGYYRTSGHARGVYAMGLMAVVADYDNLGIYDCTQAVSVDGDPGPGLPRAFALLPNYPNPFNGETLIRFELDKSERVILGIFDILGRNVITLADDNYAAGQHVVRWDGMSVDGSAVASGRYFVRAQAGGQTRSLSIMLLK